MNGIAASPFPMQEDQVQPAASLSAQGAVAAAARVPYQPSKQVSTVAKTATAASPLFWDHKQFENAYLILPLGEVLGAAHRSSVTRHEGPARFPLAGTQLRPKNSRPDKTDRVNKALAGIRARLDEAKVAYDKENFDIIYTPYALLEADHPDLWANNFIKQTTHFFTEDIPDVALDKYMIIDAEPSAENKTCGLIGTSGVASCIAICMGGMTVNNRVKLALAHVQTNLPELTLSKLHTELLREGCMANTIETYVLGGNLPDPELEFEYIVGTDETESEYLNLRYKYNIKGVRLHHNVDGNHGMYIVFGPKGIYFDTKANFKSGKKNKDVGLPL